MKTLDLIRLLCYNKHVNKLNTGTGVSTEVSLPSGSSEEIRVGSNPVIRTKRRHLDFRRGVFAILSDMLLEKNVDSSLGKMLLDKANGLTKFGENAAK